MKYWTTREGQKIKLTDMTDNHLENTIKMLGRVIDSYPGDQVYVGDSYNSEKAVESENRINRDLLEERLKAYRDLKREQTRRQPKISPVIQPSEVAQFRNVELL